MSDFTLVFKDNSMIMTCKQRPNIPDFNRINRKPIQTWIGNPFISRMEIYFMFSPAEKSWDHYHGGFMTGFCTILKRNKYTSLIPQWPSLHLMSGSLWTFTSLLLASLCYVRNSWCLSTSVTATPADDELNCGNCVHVHVKACCSWYCRLPLCPAAFGFQSSLNCLPICELESLLLLLRLLRHLPYSYRLMPEQRMMATEDLWTSLPLWRW